MTSSPSVLTDLAIFRHELAGRRIDLRAACRSNSWRPTLDIAFDWLVVVLVAIACHRLNYFAYPFAVTVIANRQRALGNLIHDASHWNLNRNKTINDLLASVCLAPALMSNLGIYRSLHFRHHAKLGKSGQDPDLLARPASAPYAWWTVYLRKAFSPADIAASIIGHVGRADLGWGHAYIMLWWGAIFGFATACAGTSFAVLFVALWFAARATVFHWITVLREMCDHFGLESGGIYSFTRDIVSGSMWRWVIHPRNNAYHLTHHLMPSVPYYHLPDTQKILSTLPSYAGRGIVCTSYFWGKASVIRHRIA